MKEITDKKRGDTIIEVIFAVTVFAAVSIGAMMIMNRGLNKTTGSLELTLVREEINAQAEAIRFIHENHVAEMSLPESSPNRRYQSLWDEIVSLRQASTEFRGNNILFGNLTAYDDTLKATACTTSGSSHKGQFIVNTRNINPADRYGTIIKGSGNGSNSSAFNTRAGTYARMIYEDPNVAGTGTGEDTNTFDPLNFTSVKRAEGIWAVNVHNTSDSDKKLNGEPAYYDVYVLSCWIAPGETVPSTLGTLIRLYNPD